MGVEQLVREGIPGDGDLENTHLGEIRLSPLPCPVPLRQDGLLVGSVLSALAGDVAMKGVQLGGLVTLKLLLAERETCHAIVRTRHAMPATHGGALPPPALIAPVYAIGGDVEREQGFALGLRYGCLDAAVGGDRLCLHTGGREG